jgi:hypothetical protein
MMALAGLLFCAVAVVSCFGWGRAAARIARSQPPAWPVAAVLGLAAVVLLGGLLNLAGLAYGWALDAVAVAGLGLAGLALWRERPAMPGPGPAAAGLAVVVLALVPAVFAAVTLVPTTLFDFLDDFSKYFAYPVRMLATGTLAGDTLNSMGWETLGGQSVLDGFVLAHGPITAINAVDVVFGLVLIGLLLAGAARRSPWASAVAAVGVVVVVVAPNQYVNVSTLFLGIALIMALMAVLCGGGESDDRLPSPVVAALLAAALAAMKPSFVPLLATGLAFAAVAFAVTAGRRAALAWTAKAAGSGLAALAPWLAVHRANLLAWLAGRGGLGEAAIPQSPPSSGFADILSFKDLPYGGSYGAFMVMLAVTLAVAAAAAGRSRPGGRPRAAAMVAMAAALLVVSVAELVYTLPRDFGYATLRYAIPSLLGVLLGELAVVASLGGAGLGRLARVAVPVLPLAAVALYGPGVAPRLAEMAEQRSMLAFHWVVDRPDFQDFSTAMVLPDATQRLRAIQAKVPAGAPLLAWVTTPFQLDYARNPVFDVDYAGLATPWARLPDAHWVLWEVKGWAVAGHESYRKDTASPMPYVARQGRRGMVLAAQLENAANHSRVAYFDGRYVVFELAQPLDRFPAVVQAR